MTIDDLLNSAPADVQVFIRPRFSTASVRPVTPPESEWRSFDGPTPAQALRTALESLQPGADDDLI